MGGSQRPRPAEVGCGVGLTRTGSGLGLGVPIPWGGGHGSAGRPRPSSGGASRTFDQKFWFDPLYIEDPLREDNNVGRNCFRVRIIQQELARAANVVAQLSATVGTVGGVVRRGWADVAAESTGEVPHGGSAPAGYALEQTFPLLSQVFSTHQQPPAVST
ncbi:hypothetical protein EMIHUDRAFT_431888 [Emiliania huxleyi CCMP1516]|uniref:Uncharacterized protein n=2 Tax=Emiliania huxleyi TaxID=2903 RepID=A0A0D3L1R8_EMIH1|nr:hypothetical protein EMIHUDRAFT_431888 [Emiliania huxleyi CCMP1516]EOD41953.1 hypothetical protein EMIHUDRAFT_431888 [Emiliania huxleyi CCMP1516]|eukprot:XP_005794382.1 hypothetical protein EMIHUDRAFT_431888 [Emiliania huxleyi CCMP1516]